MFFLLFVIAVSLIWYALNRLVLRVVRSRYDDETSPEAISGLQQAARICSALGCLLFVFYTNSMGRYSGFLFCLGLLPLVAQYLALSTTLHGRPKASDLTATDVGFNRL